jgi:4-hydroxy-tetrahydrodipicolinate synthase
VRATHGLERTIRAQHEKDRIMSKKLGPNLRISAPVTPFAANGDLMTDAYEQMVQWHLDHGATGLLIGADNGEHWALSTSEIATLTRITMRLTKLPVYVGAWAITEREAVERAVAAAEAGAYGLCIKPQHYVHSWAPATEADIVGRFAAVAKAAPLPMMVYNSYNRTGVNISHEVLHRLCDAVDVECLKDTNGDPNFIMERVLQFADKTSVLLGERTFFMGMMLGASGIMGTTIDLFGRAADRLFDYATMPVAERREWQLKLNELSAAINLFGSIPACYKAAWNLMGLPAGHLRDPLRPISREEEARLAALLEKWGILQREPARLRA